jgi:hypothetical protein
LVRLLDQVLGELGAGEASLSLVDGLLERDTHASKLADGVLSRLLSTKPARVVEFVPEQQRAKPQLGSSVRLLNPAEPHPRRVPLRVDR